MTELVAQKPAAVPAAGMQRGRPFEAGRSGNPKGRTPGSRNRITMAAEALLDGEAQALTRKAIEMALAGDVTALRFCLDRIWPPRRSRPIAVTLPALRTAQDALQALGRVAQGIVEGEVTESEARALVTTITAAQGTLEIILLEERLEALELQIRSLKDDGEEPEETLPGR